MSAGTQTFDLAPREDLRDGFYRALGMHGAIVLVIVMWGWFADDFPFGSPTGGEGRAVLITPVASVPIMRERSRVPNPVANPVQHDVPALPDPPKQTITPPDAPEIEIPAEREIKKPVAKTQPEPEAKKQRTAPERVENQLRSTDGARAQSEVLEASQDEGVGFGTTGRDAFGLGYQWYAEALQRKVSQEWRSMMGQVRAGGPRPAIITFRISRNGAIDQINVAQSSGNRTLDFTAMRAVQRSSPLRPLPSQLPKNTITVELWFEIKR